MRTAFDRSLERYRIRPYPDPVLPFRAESPLQGPDIGLRLDPYHGWGEAVTGEIEVVTVPGDHDSLVMEPRGSSRSSCARRSSGRARVASAQRASSS